MNFVIYYILICIGCKILRKHNGALSLLHWHQYYVEHSWTLGNDRQDRCLGGFCHECQWHVERHTEIISCYYLIASQKNWMALYVMKIIPALARVIIYVKYKYVRTDIFSLYIAALLFLNLPFGDQGTYLAKCYDKNPYTNRKSKKQKWQYKRSNNINIMTIADRLSHTTREGGGVKPVYVIPTFPLTKKCVIISTICE